MEIVVPKIEKVANIGTEEPFLARIVMGLPEILDVTDFANKDEIKEAIIGIFVEGLLPAHAYLQEVRDIESGKRERLIVDLNKAYIGFYNRVWAAYKDRMQKATQALGFDIGFVFKNDGEFEKGIIEFQKKYPEAPRGVVDAIKKNRFGWQQAVAKFRNEYAEHQSSYEKDVEELCSLQAMEICFQNCWTAIERILAELICTRLYEFAGVEEIPEAERDPAMPKRFRIMYRM